MSDSFETSEIRPRGPFGRILFALATGFAVFGGLVLIVIVGINFVSILGRYFFSSPLVGDFELVKMACAVAVSSFLPFCQLKQGNVIVDFVTAGLNSRTQRMLDGLSAVIFGLVAGFFTWRMIYGARDMYAYQEETMLLQLPVWIPFIPVVASFFLLSACCFYSAFVHLRGTQAATS